MRGAVKINLEKMELYSAQQCQSTRMNEFVPKVCIPIRLITKVHDIACVHTLTFIHSYIHDLLVLWQSKVFNISMIIILLLIINYILYKII